MSKITTNFTENFIEKVNDIMRLTKNLIEIAENEGTTRESFFDGIKDDKTKQQLTEALKDCPDIQAIRAQLRHREKHLEGLKDEAIKSLNFLGAPISLPRANSG